MTIGVETEAGVARVLEDRGLFRFESEVIDVIEEFTAATAQVNPNLDPIYFTQLSELTYLAAAEFALIPALSDPGGAELPPNERIVVSRPHAVLATVKYDCNLLGGCWPLRPETFSPDELTVFSADTSRFHSLIGYWPKLVTDVEGLYSFVRALEHVHLSHPSPVVNAIGESGVLRIQGLIWRLRLAVVGFPTYAGPLDAALDDSRQALETP